MSIDSFISNASELDLSIKTCIEARLFLPALILIYSGMDIMASIERKSGDKIGPTFIAWVERYALKTRPIPCTSTELYAARCGILHTLSPESDLARAGKARPIVYAWGSALPSDLQEVHHRMQRSDIVVLHIEDLRWALLEGTKLWFQEIHSDVVRLNLVEEATNRWFAGVSNEIVKQYLQFTDSKLSA